MVRAYLKPGATQGTFRYCSNCDEWESQDTEWYPYTVMVFDEGNRWSIDDDDNRFVFLEESGKEQTCWRHNNCDCYYIHSDSEEQALWICGDCSSEYSDQDDARRCCS